jgi:hypothetical protein
MTATTGFASHLSLPNVDITTQLYSLFIGYDVFIDSNATREPFNGYTS